MERTTLRQFYRDFPQVCIKSIFLRRKYYSNLFDDVTYHYPVKGICQDRINKKSKDFDGLFQLYEAFFHGNELEFDLADNKRPSIDMKNINAISRTSFL
jgi:hypothetical protein